MKATHQLQLTDQPKLLHYFFAEFGFDRFPQHSIPVPMCKFLMFAFRWEQLQVLDTIVVFDFVDMMHNLTRLKASPDAYLHNKSVLEDIIIPICMRVSMSGLVHISSPCPVNPLAISPGAASAILRYVESFSLKHLPYSSALRLHNDRYRAKHRPGHMQYYDTANESRRVILYPFVTTYTSRLGVCYNAGSHDVALLERVTELIEPATAPNGCGLVLFIAISTGLSRAIRTDGPRRG